MNVRKTATTTLALVLFIVMCALITMMPHILPYETQEVLKERFNPGSHIGGYHPFVLRVAFWLIISAGILDAVIKSSFPFTARVVFESFKVPLVLGTLIIFIAFSPLVNIFMFWLLLYIATIWASYWSFKRLINNNNPEGHKFPAFFREARLTGAGNFAVAGHIIDYYAVFGVSSLLLVFGTVILVSCVVYLVLHVRVLF